MMNLTPFSPSQSAKPMGQVRFGQLNAQQKEQFFALQDEEEYRDLFTHLNRNQLMALIQAEIQDQQTNSQGKDLFNQRFKFLLGKMTAEITSIEPEPTCEELRALKPANEDDFSSNDAYLTHEVRRIGQILVDMYTSPTPVDNATFEAACDEFINNCGC